MAKDYFYAEKLNESGTKAQFNIHNHGGFFSKPAHVVYLDMQQCQRLLMKSAENQNSKIGPSRKSLREFIYAEQDLIKANNGNAGGSRLDNDM